MSTAVSTGIRTYTGLGQSGNLADPANWSGTGGINSSSVALIPVDASLNGTVTVNRMMMLGNEAVTVNGVLNTLSNQPCLSYMVCNDAVVTFAPTATLNDAGGMIVGIEDVGTFVAEGNAGARSTLNTVDAKMGQHAGSVGTVTIDGAVWHNQTLMYVAEDGQGTLNVIDGGQISNAGNLIVGVDADGTGLVNLASGGAISVGGAVRIGTDTPASATPNGVLDIHAGGSFTSNGLMKVSAGGVVALSGGSLAVTSSGVWIAGGSVSGYGSISTGTGIDIAGGSLHADGGTLVLNGRSLFGGTLTIDANSTAQLNIAAFANSAIAFAGPGAELDLTHTPFEHAVISGFAAGDSILMAGADHIGWNASTDVLALISGSHVVEALQFTGSYTAGSFDLTQTSAGALITLGTPHALPTH